MNPAVVADRPAAGVDRRRVLGPLLASVVIAALSWGAFSAAYGVEHRPFDGLSARTLAPSPMADRLVAELEEAGLTCRVESALTDRVVVQLVEPGRAAVLTLAEAVRVLRAGEGTIQRYCL